MEGIRNRAYFHTLATQIYPKSWFKIRCGFGWIALQLSTLTEGSIELWVDSNAIPHVGRLEPKTWHQYEALRAL